jgi:hypothetical protein
MIEQVSYFPFGGNKIPDPIFLTIGECLQDIFGLYRTGLVLVKGMAPKFGSLNPKSAKWGSVKSRRYCACQFFFNLC